MVESFLNDRVTLWCGDCLSVLPGFEECSFDAVVCDPPYHLTSIVKRFGNASLQDSTKTSERARNRADGMARASRGFMGKTWDGGDIAFRPDVWREVFRVLKPGGHVVAFSGTRTYHRMACAIEDVGFEVRDQIGWLYGSGFPKSLDVSKAIDRATGAKREWEGWGTALKPAWEPICLARKPLIGTVAANVMQYRTGALNIDACRISVSDPHYARNCSGDRGHADNRSREMSFAMGCGKSSDLGRWPANVVHDGSDEVLESFPASAGAFAPVRGDEPSNVVNNVYGKRNRPGGVFHGDEGSAARFFYTAKADADDRIGSRHPTVKPVDLMQWLVRLVTPKGGVVLDPFAGTGTTAEAAWREGMRAVLIEREAEYQDDIRRRMALCLAGPDERRRSILKVRGLVEDAGPLFGGAA